MGDNVKRRHHTVPKFHLRNFASEKEQLTQLDVVTGRQMTVNFGDATVRKHFYTIVLPDGTQSQAWEDRLSDLEGEIAPVVNKIVNDQVWLLSDHEKDTLSLWIALQYMRGPDARRQMTQIASMVTRLQVGMGGIAYLRYAMERGLGTEVPDEVVERAWIDLTGPPGPQVTVSGNDHLNMIAAYVEPARLMIRDRIWGRIRFDRKSLALGDVPVTLIRGDTPESLEVGLDSAPSIAVALGRHTLLWLDLPSEMRDPDASDKTYRNRFRDAELAPSTKLASANNLAAVLQAERFVYFHTDDDLAPRDFEWPRPERVLSDPRTENDVNRERPLQDVLDQIAGHRDNSGMSLIADYIWPIPGYSPPVA
ncbi:DUF4238 domain-containing protein [Kineosporia sp. NBRC 101731]|uniref:DUF4238 domain-containing protein n=1 Tax=Kineosporia sp. NBRC 101731 TaxID=3032199 RepID=UPI0024A3DDAD|nr:DUF4238 domain-containing protein [Kineosporia sp. NBRC 101731]GLY33792.1 hypothetical protein Kisp02_71570 [Kineosporia sp. NBRC 101731]